MKHVFSMQKAPKTDVLFDKFLEISRELWSESNPQGVLRSFFILMRDTFSVSTISCLSTGFRGGKYTFQRHNSAFDRLDGVQNFGDQLIHLFQEHLGLAFLHSEPEPEGIYLTECLGTKVEWAILGQPKKGCLICLWKKPDNTELTSSLHLSVRLLQHESLWFGKLDKTQALLYMDDLTGLFNYRYLDIALESELRRAGRYHQNFCLLFIDLDNFKSVNDRHGHMAGSQVLKQTGSVLQEELREVDTIIRYGGDEYVVILLGADSDLGVLVAERIRQRISRHPFDAEKHQISLSCSIGVACYPEHGKNKESLLKIADETMYLSKKKGKNRVMLVGDQDDHPSNISPASGLS